MKDVLYLEADEDITSAIDKLAKTGAAAVQVVVPKRSTLLQSMINLKLLKKAADDHKKDLILVTTDRLSTHLAGRVGLAVASKLGAKPAVPQTATKEPDGAAEVIDGGEEETAPAPEAEAATAAAPPAKASGKPSLTKRSLEPVAEAAADEPSAAEAAAADNSGKPSGKKTRSAKVPDFNALQKRLLWGGLGVVVVIALLVLNYFLTSATVTVFAKGTAVPLQTGFSASPAASSTDIPSGVLKAQTIQTTKALSKQVTATGTQDVGSKASGTVTVENCYSPSSFTVPAGTTFTGGGKSFTSNSDVTVGGAIGNFQTGCTKPGTGSVNVTAAQNGDSYNLGPTTYSVGSYPNSASNGVVGQGNQMSGGVSKTVTVVAQSDIDGAVSDLLSGDKNSGQQGLSGKAAGGYQVLAETFTQGQTGVSSNPTVGTQASNVTVSVTATYNALAVATADLNALLKDRALKQSGQGNQVYDDGLGSAKFSLVKANTDGSQALQVVATAYVGAKLDSAVVVADVKGRPAGDASNRLSALPNVDHAEISLWPSWATKLPSRGGRIKVVIKVANSGG